MPQLSLDLCLQGQHRMPWYLRKVHCDPLPIVAIEVKGCTRALLRAGKPIGTTVDAAEDALVHLGLRLLGRTGVGAGSAQTSKRSSVIMASASRQSGTLWTEFT